MAVETTSLARLTAERDALIHERNDLMNQRNALMSARDDLMRERNMLMQERDALVVQLHEAAALAAPAVFAMTRELAAGRRVDGIDLTGTLVCAGFQGSGNGITGAILEKLTSGLPHPASDAMDIIRSCAARRSSTLVTLAGEIGRSHGFEGTGIASYHRSTATISFSPERDQDALSRVIVFGVPLANALHEPLFKTHEACSDYLVALVEQGAQVALSVRHPLDIAVSVANKARAGGVDLLRDEALLPVFLSGMVAYYRSFDRIPPGALLHARYEGLFDDFNRAVASIALFAGRARHQDLDPSRVDPTILGEDLSARRHRWRPGTGKWQQYLHEGHAEAIRHTGVDRLIEPLGYEPFEADRLAHRDEVLTLPLQVSKQGKDLAFLLSSSVDHDAVRAWIAQHATGVVTGPLTDSAFWLAPNLDAANSFATVLDDPRLAELVSWS